MNRPLNMEDVPYQFGDDGISLSINAETRTFNRGIKHGNTTLVTGDRPHFALVHMQPENALDPALLKLRDGRIRLQWEGEAIWLDDLDALETSFYPSETTYQLQWPLCPDLQINLRVGLAEDWGLVASLSLTNAAETPLTVQADFVYGGLAQHGRTLSSAYFPADAPDTIENTCVLEQEIATLRHVAFSAYALATSLPRVEPRQADGRVVFSWSITLAVHEEASSALIVGSSGAKEDLQALVVGARPFKLLEEEQQYYVRLLQTYQMATPSTLLSNGFHAAVLNLEW